jgi:alpha-L-rhamnosidase
VHELCWDRQAGLIADTPEKSHFSQHANAFAVWLDVVPAADRRGVMEKILSASDPSFTSKTAPPPQMSLASYYYRFYLARALVHAGLGNRYLETLGAWKAMVENGMTTWAEQPEPTRSDSHAWSAHPTYDLLTIVAGISPSTPNFSRVKIEPHMGALHHVDAGLPSPSGIIKVVLDANDKNLIAKITLPAGMAGTFIWNRKTHDLVPGAQQLSLPAAKK